CVIKISQVWFYGFDSMGQSLEPLDNQITKMTYFSPKKKIGFNEFNPQKTLDNLKAFALYEGKPVCKL
ncbi:MAG: hypothetical protein ACTH7L_04310, partial [Psychrobacter alimentarius]